MTYELVSGDTAPQIQATITRDNTGAVANVTGITYKAVKMFGSLKNIA